MTSWPRAIKLVGLVVTTFWASAACGRVATLSSATIPFGNVAIGGISTRNLSVTNTGTSNLVITSISDPINFQPSNCANATITPNGSCTISISFAPSSIGSSTGSLTITDNASNSPQVASLSGTGVAAVALSPPSLTFPNQAIGTASVAKLTWASTDYASDGEHPGNSGFNKVEAALINFFLTSRYTAWFR